MRLSALLMVGEDIPMTAMNVWVLAYQALTCGVSTMILVSFAFNLVMLGTRKSSLLKAFRASPPATFHVHRLQQA